jgi:O-methyltransferase
MSFFKRLRSKRLVASIISRVRPYSMVPDAGLALTISETLRVINDEVKGDLVEFGTWMGGSSFPMLLVQREVFGRVVKPVWMFDSFEGLPPAEERDGQAAIRYQANVDGPFYFDNCSAPLDKVKRAKESFGFSDSEAIIVPGWFDTTIPANIDRLSERRIALLRVDCDWYAPVKLVLDSAAPLVTENAPIILDDYYAWDGCTKATHDYLAENQLPLRIRSVQGLAGAWMIKQSFGVS